MATPRPIELYFTSPIYARGEHIVGANALNEDGKPNMVVIKRGETRLIHFDAARDLIISKQAIDNKNSKPTELAEAKESVRAFEDYLKKQDAAAEKLKKAA